MYNESTNTVQTFATAEEAIRHDTMNWADRMIGNFDLNGQYKFDTPANFYKNLDKLPTSDLEAAEWMKEALGGRYTYVNSGKKSGDWFFWDGTVHVQSNMDHEVDDKIVKAFAKALKSTMSHVQAQIATSDHMTEDQKKQLRSELNAAGGPMVYARNAYSERGMGALRKRLCWECGGEKDHFDHDMDFIVFADGMVMSTKDLTLPLMTPDPKRRVTKKLAVNRYGNDNTPGAWKTLLGSLGLGAEEQKYLQTMAGAGLLGRGDFKNFAALVGVSNTGKTTYAMSVFKVFGSYAGLLPASALIDMQGANFDQYKARGKRFILVEEPYERKVDDSYLKNLSGGGGLVSTQEKGKNGVDWKAQGALHITANHVPKINTNDDAIVDRMNIIGFNVKGKKIVDAVEKLDPADTFLRDCPQEILNWILEGAQEYNETGNIPVPTSAKGAASKNVASASVSIAWLLSECDWADEKTPPRLELIPESTTHSAMLKATKSEYTAFSMWCMEQGEKVVSKRVWEDEINRYTKEPENVHGKRPGGSTRLWGVALKDNSNVKNAMDHALSRDSHDMLEQAIRRPF